MSSSQDQFFDAVIARELPRIRVAGIVIADGALLVQQPADDERASFAFIGGEYELGDTFETRLRREFEEETNAHVIAVDYLLCVENRFRYRDAVIQQLEHYFQVQLDRRDVASAEPHLAFRWLPLTTVANVDLRPRILRDAIVDGTYLERRHLVQPL